MNNIKEIYKATIYEYESGKTDILYECDIEKNKECNKRNCDKEYCIHTLDKKYAKNYKNKTTELDTERKIYTCGVDGQCRDYLVTSYYKNGELIKEKIEAVNKD